MSQEEHQEEHQEEQRDVRLDNYISNCCTISAPQIYTFVTLPIE